MSTPHGQDTRITTWIIKFLSYAGSLQLIKSVLESMQAFWAQIFVMTNKIIQQVETMCKKNYVKREGTDKREGTSLMGYTLQAKNSRRT